MKSCLRVFVLLMPVVLAACTNTTQRQYEGCIVSMSAAGGIVGGAVSGGSGALPGIAVGAGTSVLVCKKVPAPEPARVVMAPTDSDGDGVADSNDRCPGTPPGVSVDSRGCARDSDSDGVADYADRCPGTPAGVKVDDNGCPMKDEVVLTVDRLGFAFDSAELDSASKAALDAAVPVIKSHSEVMMDVVGYTDSTGPESYNQKLSERRAQAAMAYLVSRGVDPAQLRATGRGEANPVADNASKDGRSRNRRVELVVR